MIVEGAEAAVLSLHAIGQQDTYLTEDDPKYSLFTYDPTQHANFTKFHRNTQVSNPGTTTTWPFGETISYLGLAD